jgi:hypothetical protein
VLRLGLNLPALFWAQQVGLIGGGSLSWALLAVWSLGSLIWLCWPRGEQTQVA